jgi:hypothetical protein
MTQTNRVQLAGVRETTPGTTPTTPRMLKERITGESLELFVPQFEENDELRADRMNEDATQIFKDSKGAYNFRVFYPSDLSLRSEIYRSAFYNPWTNTPYADNDGTADSVITAFALTNSVLTAAFSAAIAVGHIVRVTGATNSGNNGNHVCTTGSATAPRFSGSVFVDEAAPPAACRAKVIGFQGTAGDITATATGLASTTLDFTTLGLAVGMPVKVGGSSAGSKFATTALNVEVTISAIAAHALTFDNRPSGWTTDAGAAKTIEVYIPDMIKNGTTHTALTLEKGFLGQTVPNYHVGTGMTVNTLNHKIESKKTLSGSVSFMGMGGSTSTTAQDASPDAAPTGNLFAANVNVGRVMEGGAILASPNFCKMLEFTINNNLRQVEDITIDSPAGINEGECQVDVNFDTYYGDATYKDKFYNGTATSLFAVVKKNNQALAWFFPRVVYRGGGNPQASGKNQDVMLPLQGRSSYDSTTGAHIIMARFEYYPS